MTRPESLCNEENMSHGDKFIVVNGLTRDSVAKSIAALEERIEACRARQHCPNLAIGKPEETDMPAANLWLHTAAPKLFRDVTVLNIANEKGKRVNIVFTHESTYLNEGLRFMTQNRITGSKRLIGASGNLTNDWIDQLYTYIHMKLGGCCSANSTQNEPRMSRLDQLEVHVNALMTMEYDVDANRNQRIETRFSAVESQLAALAKRLSEQEPTSPAKRQKLEEN